MRNLVFWAVVAMVFAVGSNEALIRLGVPPDQVAFATLAAVAAFAVIAAFAATTAATLVAVFAAVFATFTAIVPFAAAVVFTIAFAVIAAVFASDLKIPYWQALALMVVEIGGIAASLLVVWWWILPAIGLEIFLYNLFAPRQVVLVSHS